MSKFAAITLFVLGALLLIATEFFRVYLIMPFPGSQQADTVGLSWSIDHYRIALRLIGFLLIAAPLVRFWRTGRTGRKILLTIASPSCLRNSSRWRNGLTSTPTPRSSNLT